MSINLDAIRIELNRMRSSRRYYINRVKVVENEDNKNAYQLKIDEIDAKIKDLEAVRSKLKYENVLVGRPRKHISSDELRKFMSDSSNNESENTADQQDKQQFEDIDVSDIEAPQNSDVSN